jgi:hypothetical protein
MPGKSLCPSTAFSHHRMAHTSDVAAIAPRRQQKRLHQKINFASRLKRIAPASPHPENILLSFYRKS